MVKENYFITNNPSACSGCTACKAVCPVDAITMQENKEGFLYPVKDMHKCINCKLCEKTCPFWQPEYNNSKTPDCLGGYLIDVDDRKQSSSGGAFYAIAKRIISNGGIVYGATMDKNLKVKHIGVDSKDGLQLLRGSKYVQSEMGDTYKEIKNFLNSGKIVYFVGTGCQVAGLKSFLKNEYDNLITSDLVCHGVPSQKLFGQHIKYLENSHKIKINSYCFRDNSRWGGCEIFTTTKGDVFKTPSYIMSPFLNAFIKGYIFRYSCYECPFSKIPRQGDVTLADLWGCKHFAPDLDRKHGISAIICNTEKGDKIIKEISPEMKLEKVSLDNIGKWNHNIMYPSRMPGQRKYVYEKIEKFGYGKVAQTIFKASIKEVTTLKIKNFIKKLIGRK